MKTGEQYIHNRTNDLYIIVGFCKVKSECETCQRETWLDGVMYKRDLLAEIYVRNIDNFNSNFHHA